MGGETAVMPYPQSVVLTAYVVRLVIIGVILSWLHKMRNSTCECAGTWKRDFLYWSLAADVVMRLLVLSVFHQTPDWIKAAVLMFDVFQLALLWSYATDLQRAACACSDGWKRELAQSWPVFRFGVIFGAIQMAVYMALLVVQMRNRKSRR